jgi:hypothetical protein
MLSVAYYLLFGCIMLTVIMLCVFLPKVIMLNVAMLNVILVNVLMLNVTIPWRALLFITNKFFKYAQLYGSSPELTEWSTSRHS